MHHSHLMQGPTKKRNVGQPRNLSLVELLWNTTHNSWASKAIWSCRTFIGQYHASSHPIPLHVARPEVTHLGVLNAQELQLKCFFHFKRSHPHHTKVLRVKRRSKVLQNELKSIVQSSMQSRLTATAWCFFRVIHKLHEMVTRSVRAHHAFISLAIKSVFSPLF